MTLEEFTTEFNLLVDTYLYDSEKDEYSMVYYDEFLESLIQTCINNNPTLLQHKNLITDFLNKTRFKELLEEAYAEDSVEGDEYEIIKKAYNRIFQKGESKVFNYTQFINEAKTKIDLTQLKSIVDDSLLSLKEVNNIKYELSEAKTKIKNGMLYPVTTMDRNGIVDDILIFIDFGSYQKNCIVATIDLDMFIPKKYKFHIKYSIEDEEIKHVAIQKLKQLIDSKEDTFEIYGIKYYTIAFSTSVDNGLFYYLVFTFK